MRASELLSKGLIDSQTAEKLLSVLDKQESKEAPVEGKTEEKTFKTLKNNITSADGDVVKTSIK